MYNMGPLNAVFGLVFFLHTMESLWRYSELWMSFFLDLFQCCCFFEKHWDCTDSLYFLYFQHTLFIAILSSCDKIPIIP